MIVEVPVMNWYRTSKVAAISPEWWREYVSHFRQVLSFEFPQTGYFSHPDDIPMGNNPIFNGDGPTDEVRGSVLKLSFSVGCKGTLYSCDISVQMSGRVDHPINVQRGGYRPYAGFSPDQFKPSANFQSNIKQATVAVQAHDLKNNTERSLLSETFTGEQAIPYSLVRAAKNVIAKDVPPNDGGGGGGRGPQRPQPSPSSGPKIRQPELVMAQATAFQPGAPTRDTPTDQGYLYHASSLDRAYEIATGGLRTHKPWEGTDQDAWPDGSTERRNYFSANAGVVHSFAPLEGKPVVLRVPMAAVKWFRENTGDIFSRKTVASKYIQIMDAQGQWHPISVLSALP